MNTSIRIVSDENFNWYAIPPELSEKFYAWTLRYSDGTEHGWEGEDFSIYALNHTLSSYVFDNMRLG